MLLPQSSAFAALKNRLNSVSQIGLLHTPSSSSFPRGGSTPTLVHTTSGGGGATGASLTAASPASLNQVGASAGSGPTTGAGTIYPSRLSKPRTADPGHSAGEHVIRWAELLDKFRQTQEKQRRRNQALLRGGDGTDRASPGDESIGPLARRMLDERIDFDESARPELSRANPSLGNRATGREGPGGRPDSAASGRLAGAPGLGSRLTPGIGLPTVATSGTGQAPVSGHKKSKSTFGRLNLGGKSNKDGKK